MGKKHSKVKMGLLLKESVAQKIRIEASRSGQSYSDYVTMLVDRYGQEKRSRTKRRV